MLPRIEIRKLVRKIGRTGWRKTLYIVGIVLGLGLLAQQTWQGYHALQQVQACVVRPGFLVATTGLYGVAYFVQMAAWALIMRSLHAPLTPQAVIKGYTLSFLPRYIPGSVWGYLSRNEWLAQMHNVSYGVSTVASLLEAAMLLVTATALGALYWLPRMWQAPLLELAITGAGMIAAWLVWQMLPWLASRMGGKRVQIDLRRSQSVGLWLAATGLYVGFWVLQGGALLTIVQTLCGDLTLGPSVAIAASALAWAIGFLVIFVPAGLGVREWTLGTLLIAFVTLQPGATLLSGQASLIAVVSRFCMIVAELLVLWIGVQGYIQSWWKRRAWAIDDGSLEQTNSE